MNLFRWMFHGTGTFRWLLQPWVQLSCSAFLRWREGLCWGNIIFFLHYCRLHLSSRRCHGFMDRSCCKSMTSFSFQWLTGWFAQVIADKKYTSGEQVLVTLRLKDGRYSSSLVVWYGQYSTYLALQSIMWFRSQWAAEHHAAAYSKIYLSDADAKWVMFEHLCLRCVL